MSMTKLREYQLEGARGIRKFRGRALLADDMGLGKSIQSLYYAFKCPKSRPVVIVCPAGLKFNWQHELKLHFNCPSTVLEGTKPRKQGFEVHEQFYIVNYDILPAWLPFLKKRGVKLVIIDECHYIKNRRTKRYRAVKKLCTGVDKIIGLSGTPLQNRPAELWPTLNLIAPEEFDSWPAFAKRYCQPKWSPWGWQYKGAARKKELHHRLKQTCMIRRLKKDVLTELPPKIRNVQIAPINNREDYRAASVNFIGWMKKKSVRKARKAAKAEAMVKMTTLLHLAAVGKLPAIFEWVDNFLEGTDEKLILFGIHRDVLGPIFERYKKVAVRIDGSTTGRKRQLAVDQFQTDPKIRLAVCNQKAAGVGLNMTAATAVLFVELGWVPSDHTQAEDRAHRLGQIADVFIYYLIARDTLEEPMCELIHEKQSIIDQVMDNKPGNTSLDLIGPMLRAVSKLAA